MTSNISEASLSLKVLTTAPRKGNKSTKPSDAKTFKASRMGVLETPKSLLISNSGTLSPGLIWDSTIKLRKRAVTSVCKEVLAIGSLVAIG